MPDVYMSALELERKLKSDDDAFAVKHLAKLEAEEAKLAAKAAAGTIDDNGKRRHEVIKKLISGEKSAGKLVERKKFKPGSSDCAGMRLSCSVMMHPLNLKSAL